MVFQSVQNMQDVYFCLYIKYIISDENLNRKIFSDNVEMSVVYNIQANKTTNQILANKRKHLIDFFLILIFYFFE